jgi:hypothetical protein
MKRIRRHGMTFILSLVTVCALATFARGDDPPAAATPNAPIAPLPPNSGAAPSTPDSAVASAREESASSVASSFTPNMIGDQLGGPIFRVSIGRLNTEGKILSFQVPSPSASILGVQRFADNDCTLPTDRIFSDYSFFHDAQLGTPSDANRFVPGFEKTFFDGRMSVEMRFPIGNLASSDFTVNGASLGTTDQFGDIQVIIKGLLYRDQTWALGMGMDVSIPTAPGVNVQNFTGGPLASIGNQSTHLLPYFAMLATPNDDWFVQADVQMDIAANGNDVSFSQFGNNLTSVGTIYDQTLIFTDVSIGRWLYRNPSQQFSGLAAVVEAHYTGGLNAPSATGTRNFLLAYNTAEFNVLDLTVGAHAVIGNTTVTLGFATPVTDDRTFDGELRLFVNRRF